MLIIFYKKILSLGESNSMKYSIVIPCYNEQGNIKKIVNNLQKMKKIYNIEYVLVENGSNDDTKKELEKYCKGKRGFKLVYVNKNQGYGYGIQKGLEVATGDYVGWIHADMQVKPRELVSFIKFLENSHPKDKYFLKGYRKNRKVKDIIFTMGMTWFEFFVFQRRMYDIGAIPVLFHRSLIEDMYFHKAPYDFSIELYTYYQAQKKNFIIKRKKVFLEERKNGKSSWNTGLYSKFKQSYIIMKDSIKIKKGVQVR